MNERIQPLIIQDYINLARQNNRISFAAGLPDIKVLPLSKLKESYASMISHSDDHFQYSPPIYELKQKIIKLMQDQSVVCTEDEILITNGAQQGLYLTSNLFFELNAAVMIEEFVYPGFLQIAHMFNLKYLSVPSDILDGMDLEYLEDLLRTRNALSYLYVVCNGHNPQAFTLSNKKRKYLAFLAEKYNFVIIALLCWEFKHFKFSIFFELYINGE